MGQAEQEDVLILAIESSCDETAAAVVKNGREVLSNVIYTQIALHTKYGGVVPEIASRKHIEKINQVIEEALKQAGVTLEDITAIAVTYGGAAFRHLGNYRRPSGVCHYLAGVQKSGEAPEKHLTKAEYSLIIKADRMKSIDKNRLNRTYQEVTRLKNRIFQSRDLCLRALDTNSACTKKCAQK